MAADFSRYLKQMDIAGILAERVTALTSYWEELLGTTIEDVFVSDTTLADGTREYGSLWLFTNEAVIECRAFGSSDDYDVIRVKNTIMRLLIQQKALRNGEAGSDSRMEVEVSIGKVGARLIGQFTASRKNCEKLDQIVRTFFVPNLA